jgi:hypothetical protein
MKKNIVMLLGCLLSLESYADIPFSVLKTCMEREPQKVNISIVEMDTAGPSDDVMWSGCENQYDRVYDNHLYGNVYCGNDFYFILRDKLFDSKKAENFSVSPYFKPGYPVDNRAFWYKITKDNESYICVNSSLTDSGKGASKLHYYFFENAFSETEPVKAYYYYFGNNTFDTASGMTKVLKDSDGKSCE